MARTLPARMWDDPSRIDLALDSRAVTFENPTGDAGAGGQSHGGRKGAPSRLVNRASRSCSPTCRTGNRAPRLVHGPARATRSAARARLEVLYDGRDEPSIAVPLLDFFGSRSAGPSRTRRRSRARRKDAASTRTSRCRSATAPRRVTNDSRAPSCSTSRSTTRSGRCADDAACCTCVPA